MQNGLGQKGGLQVANKMLLNLLRYMHKIEPEAIERLIETRVPVGDALLKDQNPITFHVTTHSEEGGPQQLGLLGLLNGFVGFGWEKLYAIYDDQNKLTGFRLGPKYTMGKEVTDGGPSVEGGHGPELREEAAGPPAGRQGGV